MGKPYSEELDAFADTYKWAAKQEVARLSHFIQRWSGDYATVVGSGGSYSAAVVAALFREAAHHSPTTAVTPLEFLALLSRLSPRALLLSAEGKNRDIIFVARAAAAADLASAALTLTQRNPLLDLCHESSAVRAFAFQMDWGKDGYLATNSLLATVLLLYRAFFGDHEFERLAQYFDEDRLARRRETLSRVVTRHAARHNDLLVIHSANAKPFATDLESKLAEAALATVQLTDLRQFAHGRHIQLALRSPPPLTLVVSSSKDRSLTSATARLLPDPARLWELELEGERDQDIAVTGLVDAMFLTEALAQGASHDPGQPPVTTFGREIHALDLGAMSRADSDRTLSTRFELAADRKLAVGVHPRQGSRPEVLAAAADFAERIMSCRIKAVVCDFDGTLCRAENRFVGMAPGHVKQVSKLIRQGLTFAIATGRGGSLHDSLRGAFDTDLHEQISVGYYSGTLLTRLSEPFHLPAANPEFSELWEWLRCSICSHLCSPLEDCARGGQFSVRLQSPQHCARLQTAIRSWLMGTGRTGWRVFCSGHSVDVLDAQTSKRLVVDRISEAHGLNPMSEILRIGDAGHEDGNDFELLRDGLSLSCERVSFALDSCWNFGAAGSSQAEVTMTYLSGLVRLDDGFELSSSALYAK